MTQIGNALYWALQIPEHRHSEITDELAHRIVHGPKPGETLEFILKLARAIEDRMETKFGGKP